MRFCAVFLLTFVISLTYVFTAPLEKRNSSPADGTGVAYFMVATSTSTAKNAAGKFAKFADQYVKPIWLSNKGPKGSKKFKKKKKSKENDGGSAKGKSNRKGNSRRRRRRRNRNKNIRKRLNGFKLAFIVPLSELLGDFQEDRNVEDDMKIIMTWNDGDDKQIVLIEPFDTLSLNKPHNNQLTRQKRDYTSQITSSEFKPLKETLITPNEDITELGYYRNNKLNSILKKLENNKIVGHNEFEESLWNKSQVEENSLYSVENADEEIRALALNIAKPTSNPYHNVKKNQADHSGKTVNTKSGVSSDESSNYIPKFEDVENETITNENPQPNLKQNELSTNNSNKNIKPLTKPSKQHNNSPKMEENTHQPSVINSNPSKNQINNNLENNSDKLMLEEDTNSGESFSNVPKPTKIEKQKNKIQPISTIEFDDLSVETEEMSQKTPIFNNFKQNGLEESIVKPKENQNDIKKNVVPKTKESAQEYINDNVLKDNDSKIIKNIVEHPGIKIPNNAKNKMSEEDRILPKFSTIHNQELNKLDKLMDVNTKGTFNESSPDNKNLVKHNPISNRLKDNGLQNTSNNLGGPVRQIPNDLKIEMSKQNSKIPKVSSTNIPELTKIEKLENMPNIKHSKNPDDDAKDFSLETEEQSIEIPFHENVKKDKSQYNVINNTRLPNISEISESVEANENKELPKINYLQKMNNSKGNNNILVKQSPKIVSTSNISKMNEVPKISPNAQKSNENSISRDDSIYISNFVELEGSPQVNIQKTSSTNEDKLSDNAIQTKLKVETPNSKLSEQNLLDTNETFKISTPKIYDISQVDRSDSLDNKSFLNSMEHFSDELEGTIIVSTGSFSSSKDHTKQNSRKIDGSRPKYDEKDFSNNPVIGDVIGHGKIKNDENLERSNSMDTKLKETINDDGNEDISNAISFNFDEDPNIYDSKKLSEANDMTVNEPTFGDTKVSKKNMNNSTHNQDYKKQPPTNEIKNFKPKPKSEETSSLPFNSLKPIKEHMLKPTNDKRNPDITNINIISKPNTDEPTIAVNSNPSNILSKNISPKLPNYKLKATDSEIQAPVNEDTETGKQNNHVNQYTPKPNNDPFDSLGGESFFDSIEHLPSSGFEIAPKSDNTFLINEHNENPTDNVYKTENNIPNTKFKEISSELSNNYLNIDNDQLINSAEGISNVVDDALSPNQFNSNGFDPFTGLEDKSFLMSNEMISNELQNVPASENSSSKKQQINKTDIDEKVQSFSDTIPNKHNLGETNKDIENPTDDEKHKNDNLNNLSQHSLHDPLDSSMDKSFFNPIKELSNKLSSTPINEGLNLSKKDNEKLETDEENRNMLEMAANESLLSENKNNIDDVLKPKHNKPIIPANFNPSTIGSKYVLPGSSNHESKATDGEIQTPVYKDTGKQNNNINQYPPHPNNDPFDNLGGESFFDSIEHLPSSGLEIAPKSGNTILTGDNSEKPIDNVYKTENNTPNTKFKEISSELSNNYLNIDNDQLINSAEGISNVIDDALSPNHFNSNGFDPFTGLEDKSFLMSNEMVSNELQNVPASENSSSKKQQIKETDIDKKIQSLSDTIPKKHNLGETNKDIENPTDDKNHNNDNLNNLSQYSLHDPLDSTMDKSFSNPIKELSNKLSSTPINEDLNSSKKENEKLETDEENGNVLEMATNESLLSEKKNKIDDILIPKHDKPIIAANFNPSTIGSKNVLPGSSNHESKATDGEIQTPVYEDTGKQNNNINQYTPHPNNDPFDNLGGESFFDSIEHLPSSGLEIAPKSGNTILTGDNSEKPIDNVYMTENNTPNTKFKEISSELSNNYLNIDNDQLINSAEGISNVIDDALSPNQFNSNDFDHFNGLEDKSFFMSNEMISNELQNVPASENSSSKKQQITETDLDEKVQSFSDTIPNKHNLGETNKDIENPTDDEKHKNDNLNNLSQHSLHDPLDSTMDKSFFNPIKELPNKLSSTPINEDLNSNLNPFNSLEDKFLMSNEMVSNELQNVPVSENSSLKKQQIKKTDMDDKIQSFSDTIPNKHNLGEKNENDQLINSADGISNVLDEPLSLNQLNSNGFDPFNSLEESFSSLNERVSDEPHNVLFIENSDVNNNRSENNKSESKKVSLTSEIKTETTDTLNNDKTTAEENGGNPIAPHIFNSITYNPDLSNNNKKYNSVDENNSQFNTKVSEILSSDTKYSKEGSLSIKSNRQKTGPIISLNNPMDNVYSDGSHQDYYINDNLLPTTVEDLIDDISGANKGDLSEILDTQHDLPSNRETINANNVLKAELTDHINNNDKSTKESIDEFKNTLPEQKSKEISSELLNSALNTFDGKIQSPFDNNIQYKNDKPKNFEERISNQVYDPFSSSDGESFFDPIKHLPTNKLQSLSKTENTVSMNDHNPKIINKDTAKDTANKHKFKNNSSGLLNNDSDLNTGKTNKPFDSIKDPIIKPHITDQFTSKQSHDVSNSLEDKSLTFSNKIFSGEQQNVPIVDNSFLEKSQNKLPAPSEKTNVLPEIFTNEPLSSKIDVNKSDALNLNDLSKSKFSGTSQVQNALNPTINNSNILNSHPKPINTPVDSVNKKESEDSNNNLMNNFKEHFIDNKSDIDKGNLSDLIDGIDDTEKLNKYLEKINKIINNANVSNTNLKLAQQEPNTPSNTEEKQKSIIFSPTASNHQYTNIFKNPKTNKVLSISDGGELTDSHKKIDNAGATTFSSLNHEKTESADLNEQKSGYNLKDLASTSIKTMYDYLSSDNKVGKLDDNTLSETISANNGDNSYLTGKYSDQLSKKPLAQQTKEPIHQIENNPNTSILNSNDIKNVNHSEKDTPKINGETSLVINDKSKDYIPDLIENSGSNEKNKIYKVFNKFIDSRNNIGDFFTPTLDSTAFNPKKMSERQDYNSYGFMIPKFRTKYEGGHSNDLWESIPPKQNNNFNTNDELGNFDNILKSKQIPNENYNPNMLSSHINNKELNAWDESIKTNNGINTDDKLDINNNNEFINEYIKSLTEKLLNRMDEIDGKITKLNSFSNSLIDNQGIADEKTDNPKMIEYLSTNTNLNGPSIKNINKELESKQNEIIEKLDEGESDNESKIMQHKKIKHEKTNRKKSRKHKEDNHEQEDSISEIHRNYKNKNTEKRKKHSNNNNNNNNSYYNSSNGSNDVEVGKKHRKNIRTNSSNDSKDVVLKRRRKKPYENDSSYSDDINVQPKDRSKRKKKRKRKKIIDSSQNDTKENYSSSIGISDMSYDSVRNLKANDRSEKSKRTKIAEKKSTKKSHSTHSKHSNDSKDITINKKRKKHLSDDSSYGKTMVSKKRYVKDIHSEEDEAKEPKKKKKRKKKKKKIDIKNIKENNTQAINYDSNDNKSDEYEYVTLYPKIQYASPLSRLFM